MELLLLQTRRVTLLVLLLLILGIFSQANALPKPKPSSGVQDPKNLRNLKSNDDIASILQGINNREDERSLDLLPRGGAEIDKSETWSLSDMPAMDVVYIAIHGAF